jgi:hypothetical protein
MPAVFPPPEQPMALQITPGYAGLTPAVTWETQEELREEVDQSR